MVTAEQDGHEQVVSSTRAFIEALKATGALRRFAEATRRFDSDPEVQSLMKRLQEFQRSQRTADISAAGLEEIRDTQKRFGTHPVVREFMSARDALASLLQETNVEISQILGVNFGQTAGPARGSCS